MVEGAESLEIQAGKKTLEETVEELSLMLLYLTRFQDNNEFCRYMEIAWKGYPFGVLDHLEEQDFIIQPRKSKYAYLTEKGKECARALLQKYQLPDQELYERFEFRNIRRGEAGQAAESECLCFPPHEACTKERMLARAKAAPELFLVAMDKSTGNMAGFLTGLSTEEYSFRDEFFTDITLHNPQGRNVMILSLGVHPAYRRQGLARELMYQYLRRQRENGKRMVLLTCLPNKVKMYRRMGFRDQGIADSVWGGEQWHEMSCVINC